MSPNDLFVSRELTALGLPGADALPDGTWLVELPAEHASRAWNHFAAHFEHSGVYPLFVADVSDVRQRCAESFEVLPVPAALLSRAAANDAHGLAAWRAFEERASRLEMRREVGLLSAQQLGESLAALLIADFPAPSSARTAVAPRELSLTPTPWPSGLLLTPCEAPWMMPFLLRRRPFEQLTTFRRWTLECGAVPTSFDGTAFVFQAEVGRFEALAEQARRDAFADTALAMTLQQLNGLMLLDDVEGIAVSGLLGA
jgi:hypothetical protein